MVQGKKENAGGAEFIAEKYKEKTKDQSKSPPSEDLTSQLENSFNTSVPYETPAKFKKQIRQQTSDCHSKLPQSKELKCAVVNHVVGKMLKSPSTSSTMCQIIQRYNKLLLKKCDCNYSSLVSDVVKLQKHRCRKKTKFMECVNHVREKYSIWVAAKQPKMHYNQLYRLLSYRRKPHGWALSQSAKENVIQRYSSNKILMQLPFRRYARFYFLRSSLSIAYDTYAREQMKLSFRVLSQSTVYQCLKGKFHIRKKIPFKDTQCTDCVNNGLLVDALIVAKVKGIKRRITQNVLNSFCPLEKPLDFTEGSVMSTSRKLEWEIDKELITDHNHGYIFRVCKKCGTIPILQESIIKQNSDVDWDQEVMWHQWKYILQEGQNDP